MAPGASTRTQNLPQKPGGDSSGLKPAGHGASSEHLRWTFQALQGYTVTVQVSCSSERISCSLLILIMRAMHSIDVTLLVWEASLDRAAPCHGVHVSALRIAT
jgi:hypothetical protein